MPGHLPGLDAYDRSDDASPQARQRRRISPDNRELSTRGPALGHFHDCWCGVPYPHDWPGKDEGAPHPREVL
jgi:hypothetical protein